MNKIFVTLFFVGLAPKASGTFGSFFALVLGAVIVYYLGNATIVSATIAIGIIAGFEISKYQKTTQRHDPKEVVIDELVGMWICLSIVPFGLVEYALAFLSFRLFDIWKPSIIGRIDRNMKNGFGVVLDDVLAGFFGSLLTLACLKILSVLEIYGV